ncbi:helix-turn-helix domain-containing protein [Planococcus sp. 1R117A]|uniref:helix-turn-helix domain-containing protein n=1 Tax=Planococcus sp. 1R117A TaxID=3447020 RepID=UPI003EDC7CEC
MKGLEYIVKEFKMDYKEVAKSLGITTSTINDWVNKNKKIPDKRLDQLADLFSCSKTYFQKELTFEEMAEVRIQYLRSISIKQTEPVTDENGRMVGYYEKESYEEEIQFLKSLIQEKEKQNYIRNTVESLMADESIFNKEESLNIEEINNSSHIDLSDTETLSRVMKVMSDKNLIDRFKVIMYILNIDEELLDLPLTAVAKKYKDFAEGFAELLKNTK